MNFPVAATGSWTPCACYCLVVTLYCLLRSITAHCWTEMAYSKENFGQVWTQWRAWRMSYSITVVWGQTPCSGVQKQRLT